MSSKTQSSGMISFVQSGENMSVSLKCHNKLGGGVIKFTLIIENKKELSDWNLSLNKVNEKENKQKLN